MTYFVLTALTVITVQLSLCQAGLGPGVEESESGVPRLISRKCKTKGRYFEPEEIFSVPCVPQDLDTVCRSNNFLRAIAIGNPERPDSLRRRPCLVSRRSGRRGSCPTDSTCVRVQKRRGVCCYGDLTDTNAEDPKCPDACGQPCPSGESCQKCGDDFACLPKVKPGSCQGTPFYCWPRGPGEKCWCRNDDDCAGSEKCCRDLCGRSRCREPSDAPPLVCPSTSTTPEPTEASTASSTESSTSSTSGDPPL